MKKSILSLVLACALAIPLALGVQDEAAAQTLGDRGVVVKVTNVVDGDTVDISREVRGEDRVRLIGVDTPEVYGGKQPYGPAASTYATQELEGKKIALQFDEEGKDSYGRLLAYVWQTPSNMFNNKLVARGYAQRATYLPNDRYEPTFLRTQRVAKQKEIRIWGLPRAQQCKLANHGNGIGEGTRGCDDGGSGGGGDSQLGVPPATKSTCPSTHRIKGNIASDGEKIYHVPGGQYYKIADPERCFSSQTQARNAGYRASLR